MSSYDMIRQCLQHQGGRGSFDVLGNPLIEFQTEATDEQHHARRRAPAVPADLDRHRAYHAAIAYDADGPAGAAPNLVLWNGERHQYVLTLKDDLPPSSIIEEVVLQEAMRLSEKRRLTF